MTWRLWLLSGLLYGLLFAGLITLRGEVIALAIPLAIYLGAALLQDAQGASELRLAAQRSLSAETTSPGMSVEIHLAVTNHGAYLEELYLEDEIPEGLERVKGESQLLTRLASGETAELVYTVRGPRGRYDFRGVQASAGDTLGLLRRRTWLPAVRHLLILPAVNRLRAVPIRPRRTHVYSGPYPARQGGAGVSLYGVREYQSGDPLRWINWRATARHSSADDASAASTGYRGYYTTEFEQERIAEIGLILDSREQSNIRSGGESLFEYSVQATASLADALLAVGNRVGLLIYGRAQEMTFPGYGKVQRERILRALGRARTGDNYALESLSNLPTRLFPAHSYLVLVSPLLRDDQPVLLRLRALGYQVLVISPDPIHFVASKGLPLSYPLGKVDDRVIELAVRIARLERSLLLRRLMRAGVQVVDWPVERPLDQVLQARLKARLPGSLQGGGGEFYPSAEAAGSWMDAAVEQRSAEEALWRTSAADSAGVAQ